MSWHVTGKLGLLCAFAAILVGLGVAEGGHTDVALAASGAQNSASEPCFSWGLELPRSGFSWETVQGGTLDVVDDPTRSGRGRIYRATIPPIDSAALPEIEWTVGGTIPLYVYRVYGFISLPYHPAPCTTAIDVWASEELVRTSGGAKRGTIILDVYDVCTDTTVPGAWEDPYGQLVSSKLQVVLGDDWRTEGVDAGSLRLQCTGQCDRTPLPERDAPPFTAGVWHSVNVRVSPDRTVELFQDGILVQRATLSSIPLGGTTGGHPGLYIKNEADRGEYSVRGVFLIDDYTITCGACQSGG